MSKVLIDSEDLQGFRLPVIEYLPVTQCGMCSGFFAEQKMSRYMVGLCLRCQEDKDAIDRAYREEEREWKETKK